MSSSGDSIAAKILAFYGCGVDDRSSARLRDQHEKRNVRHRPILSFLEENFRFEDYSDLNYDRSQMLRIHENQVVDELDLLWLHLSYVAPYAAFSRTGKILSREEFEADPTARELTSVLLRNGWEVLCRSVLVTPVRHDGEDSTFFGALFCCDGSIT